MNAGCVAEGLWRSGFSSGSFVMGFGTTTTTASVVKISSVLFVSTCLPWGESHSCKISCTEINQVDSNAWLIVTATHITLPNIHIYSIFIINPVDKSTDNFSHLEMWYVGWLVQFKYHSKYWMDCYEVWYTYSCVPADKSKLFPSFHLVSPLTYSFEISHDLLNKLAHNFPQTDIIVPRQWISQTLEIFWPSL